MGDFTLGCLLGQYDRAQSFDVDSAEITGATAANSWFRFSTQNSMYYTGRADFSDPDVAVHSSDQALRMDVFSTGNADTRVMIHLYGRDNDAYGRWFPEVTTHGVRADLWGNMGAAAESGFIIARLGAGVVQQAIPRNAGASNAMRIETVVQSESTNQPRLYFFRSSATNSGCRVWLDDVLTQIDPITLFPEFEFQEAERSIRSQHRTLGGRLHTYIWDKYGAWSMPLRYLPTSHADLLNWWWQQGLNLAFTLDTSDSESIHVVRIVNERQPIGSRERPYNDLWQGTLQLEAIGGGTLAF